MRVLTDLKGGEGKNLVFQQTKSTGKFFQSIFITLFITLIKDKERGDLLYENQTFTGQNFGQKD